MNTLSLPAFLRGILSSKAVSECVSAFKTGKFPLEIRGSEGAFGAILLDILPGGPFAAVVPTELAANELALDLQTLGLHAAVFPWWGTMPYKEMAPMSGVFGERTEILCALAQARGAKMDVARGATPDALPPKSVYIIPERAFLTPLPPPEYIKSLLIPITVGETVDTVALAERLVSYGYTRVPRVQLHGEFTLRGEVLDILMGGDDAAYRVLLDFDRVETIRRFDTANQSSIGARGAETLPGFLIRPLREVIWTDERIEELGNTLDTLEEFPDKGRAVLETLMERRSCPGEEMFYPLAFSKDLPAHGPTGHGPTGHGPASLVDYLEDMPVFFFDRERLEHAQEAIEREYENL
ncbi:MAG: transcription-repair coupling factor, partial [Treponema sp.]|nr:transcription-repair coupling factor [Treponema sp.]